jgi:hypothetical protein
MVDLLSPEADLRLSPPVKGCFKEQQQDPVSGNWPVASSASSILRA